MNTNFFIGFSVVPARTHEGGGAGAGEAVVSQNNLALVMIRGTGNCHCILHLLSETFHAFPSISVIFMMHLWLTDKLLSNKISNYSFDSMEHILKCNFQ